MKSTPGEDKTACSQAYRDRHFAPGWRWNTWHCDRLARPARKQCNRAIRGLCVAKQREAGRSRRKAENRCGVGADRKFAKCLKDMSQKYGDMSRARRKCKKRKKRYLKKVAKFIAKSFSS